MPVFCENRLYVSGTEETISKIIAATKLNDGRFDFNEIVPMPSELKDRCNWSIPNWGTRSAEGEDVNIVSITPSGFEFEFNTAWTPPIPFIKVLCEKYTDAEIVMTYNNPSDGVSGKIIGSDGRLVELRYNDCLRGIANEYFV